MLLKPQIIQNSNDFVNAVNDGLRNIDLIHKRQKNYLESGKEDPKRYYMLSTS